MAHYISSSPAPGVYRRQEFTWAGATASRLNKIGTDNATARITPPRTPALVRDPAHPAPGHLPGRLSRCMELEQSLRIAYAPCRLHRGTGADIHFSSAMQSPRCRRLTPSACDDTGTGTTPRQRGAASGPSCCPRRLRKQNKPLTRCAAGRVPGRYWLQNSSGADPTG